MTFRGKFSTLIGVAVVVMVLDSWLLLTLVSCLFMLACALVYHEPWQLASWNLVRRVKDPVEFIPELVIRGTILLITFSYALWQTLVAFLVAFLGADPWQGNLLLGYTHPVIVATTVAAVYLVTGYRLILRAGATS